MGIRPSQQLLAFALSVLLGFSAGILYDLLRPFRLRFPRITGLLDGAYCLASGGAAFLFLLRRSDGELRGFLLLGAAGGAILFFCLFSHPLRPVWDFWADTLIQLAALAVLPLILLRRLCKKTLRLGKNLFYFSKKCYTIIRINHDTARRRQQWTERKPKQSSRNGHGPVC